MSDRVCLKDLGSKHCRIQLLQETLKIMFLALNCGSFYVSPFTGNLVEPSEP